MPRFFVSEAPGEQVVLTGGSAAHISRSLRMQPGDSLTLCDGFAHDYPCEIVSVGEQVVLRVLGCEDSRSEPSVRLHLYQAVPKADKLEFIVQKAVELGAADITPVLTSRCISRPKPAAMEKKRARCQKISEEAAKQSGRGIIPAVRPLLSFREAVAEMAQAQAAVFFYECGGEPLSGLVPPSAAEVSFMIGSEGGFAPEEAAFAQQAGLQTASLGSRILRCETAPLCALSVLLYMTGNL